MTAMLRIEGSRITRYLRGKRRESVDMELPDGVSRAAIGETLEDLRINGLPPEPEKVGAPEVDPLFASIGVFLFMAEALELNPPAMTPRFPELAA